jgi:hypothetical protein
MAKFKCEIKMLNNQANIDIKLQTIKSLLNMGVVKTIQRFVSFDQIYIVRRQSKSSVVSNLGGGG